MLTTAISDVEISAVCLKFAVMSYNRILENFLELKTYNQN